MRAANARAANERIARRAQELRFVSPVPLLCECDDPGCHDIIPIDLDSYHDIRADPRRYLTAPGHQLDQGQPQTKKTHYWLHTR